MSVNIININFSSCSRGVWLHHVSDYYDSLRVCTEKDKVRIDISPDIMPQDLEPVHLVTLACLIQSVYNKGVEISIRSNESGTPQYIYDTLGFKYYWTRGYNHVDAIEADNIFNLWRIVDTEKDIYAKRVESYLKQNFFQGKDLSAISVSLIEAFYNVFDHAQANGNAFSLIKFDKKRQKLSVAISDFGIGIARTIKENFEGKSIVDDVDALKFSIENSVTIRSTEHNKGLGLGNILSSVDDIRIFSNKGLFVKNSDNQKFFIPDFSFPGTLIYFDVDLSDLDDEEILDSFSF